MKNLFIIIFIYQLKFYTYTLLTFCMYDTFLKNGRQDYKASSIYFIEYTSTLFENERNFNIFVNEVQSRKKVSEN